MVIEVNKDIDRYKETLVMGLTAIIIQMWMRITDSQCTVFRT